MPANSFEAASPFQFVSAAGDPPRGFDTNDRFYQFIAQTPKIITELMSDMVVLASRREWERRDAIRSDMKATPSEQQRRMEASRDFFDYLQGSLVLSMTATSKHMSASLDFFRDGLGEQALLLELVQEAKPDRDDLGKMSMHQLGVLVGLDEDSVATTLWPGNDGLGLSHRGEVGAVAGDPRPPLSSEREATPHEGTLGGASSPLSSPGSPHKPQKKRVTARISHNKKKAQRVQEPSRLRAHRALQFDFAYACNACELRLASPSSLSHSASTMIGNWDLLPDCRWVYRAAFSQGHHIVAFLSQTASTHLPPTVTFLPPTVIFSFRVIHALPFPHPTSSLPLAVPAVYTMVNASFERRTSVSSEPSDGDIRRQSWVEYHASSSGSDEEVDSAAPGWPYLPDNRPHPHSATATFNPDYPANTPFDSPTFSLPSTWPQGEFSGRGTPGATTSEDAISCFMEGKHPLAGDANTRQLSDYGDPSLAIAHHPHTSTECIIRELLAFTPQVLKAYLREDIVLVREIGRIIHHHSVWLAARLMRDQELPGTSEAARFEMRSHDVWTQGLHVDSGDVRGMVRSEVEARRYALERHEQLRQVCDLRIRRTLLELR
ncbi:hypothetical protein P7C70_g1502, partial [Phenoliferia sp. Uapishka_3]